MTLNHLRYALMLQETGHFKKAAVRLHITQPALSLQIRQLEDEVGIKLFDRSTTPVEPTVDGREFLKRAQEIVTQTQKLENFSQELQQDYCGTLKIGIIPTLAPFLIPLFVNNLQADYPEFKLDFHELVTEEIIRELRMGALDVGLLSTPVTSPGIEHIPLFYEKFYLYTSEENAVQSFNLRTIDHKELWLLNEGNCFRDQVSNFCDLNKIRSYKRFVYRTNSIEALIKIVDHKGGITIVPELATLALNVDQEIRLREIGAPKKKAREIGMVMIANYDKKRFIDQLGAYIRSNVPGHMLSPEGYEVIDPQINV